MADANITLSIRYDSDGLPPSVTAAPVLPANATDADRIPWRMAQVKRSELPDKHKHRRVGHRPKIRDYYYRFTGGNGTFPDDVPDDQLVEVHDGDFEFTPNRGRKTVKIEMDTVTGNAGWEFHSVSLSRPLYQTNGLPDTEIRINFDTNDETITSGQIGMVVRKPKNAVPPGQSKKALLPEEYDYLYVDPDWDNRH